MRALMRRVLLSAAMVMPVVAMAQTPAPPGAYLYIIWPNEGDKIKGGFWCRFGLRNMGVARAGDRAPNTGHHHLLVDVDGPLDPNEPIPSDKNHLHFGGGQTEVRLELPPGEHTLQLVLGDADHKLFKPAVVSRKIHITVLEVAAPAAAQATPRARAESSPPPRNR
jgi:hypothetical protein